MEVVTLAHGSGGSLTGDTDAARAADARGECGEGRSRECEYNAQIHDFISSLIL